ncbi:MAG TPA: hypothetical protein VFZ08_16655 [Terriglobia bacterium]|nr:hypothetical protein [Terriglobia bacterium]
MSLPQQFSSQSQQPIPPQPRTAAFAAALSGQQPVKEVGTQPRTALPMFGRRRSLTQPLFEVSTTGGFEEPLPLFLEEESVIVKHRMSSECAGKRLNISRNTGYQEIFRITMQHLSAHIMPQVSWNTPEQENYRDSALSGLDEVYVIDNRSAVAAFIKRNRLLGLLIEAWEPLSAAFGETTVNKLTLVEDDEGFTTLFCLVLFPGGLDEAKRALDLFDESWWLAHAHEGAGRVNFDFELT